MNRELHRKLDRVVEQAIEHFGADKQIEKSKEEFTELLVALQKLTQIEPNQGRNVEQFKAAREKVREELADTQIMLAQLICIFDADEVTKHIDVKTCRLDLMMLEQKEERRSQERYSDIEKANEELNQAKMRKAGKEDCESHRHHRGQSLIQSLVEGIAENLRAAEQREKEKQQEKSCDEASQGCCIPEDMKLQNGRFTERQMFRDNS